MGSRDPSGFDAALLSAVEDAGLNASAPPQQRWLDGWLVRFSPGKAQRARCINAVAPGRRPLASKLRECAELFAEQGLPLLLRITPFTMPPSLDSELEALGFEAHDPTCVMVRAALPGVTTNPLPTGLEIAELAAPEFAQAVGALRGSPERERHAQAERLAHAPVPYRGFVLRRAGEGVLACGQIATERDLVGLYDIVTHPEQRRQGHAGILCEHLLTLAEREGARSAYLQVGADNEPARRIYRRLGFSDAYRYHYRRPRQLAT